VKLDELLAQPEVASSIAAGDTPFFILDPAAAVAAYDGLRAALPGVVHHYAVKSNSHPALIRALVAAGASFDVATNAEIDLVLECGGTADRIIHTHPHVKPRDMTYAIERGVRTFVADSDAQIRKLAAQQVPDVAALARVSYPNAGALVDLSLKFGLAPDEVPGFLDYAADHGVRVRGLSYHVGSQNTDPGVFAGSLRSTVSLLRSAAQAGHVMDTIDLGGGFPVDYRQAVPDVESIGGLLRPILEDVPELSIWSEPGRYISAGAMHLVTSVVAETYRPGAERHWVYIDDGLFGGYSNVLTDHVDPEIVAVGIPSGRERVAQTIAGPTCDSTDVVARDVDLPRLVVGDVLVSPMMGAYSLVTATGFNGIPITRVIVV
jgi:ornithine decarboxylase